MPLNIKKMLSSAGLMSLLMRCIVPLRMLILAPLMFTRLQKADLDVYYLMSAAGIFGILVAGRLMDVFASMLSYAYAGQENLSAIDLSRKSLMTSGGAPNWWAFGHGLAALSRLERILIGPLLLMTSGLAFFSLHGLWGLEGFTPYRIVLAVAGMTAANIVFFSTHIEAGMMGMQQNALQYRLHAICLVIGIALELAALFSGYGLFAVFLAQILVGIIKVALFRWNFRPPVEAKLAWREASRERIHQIVSWAAKPSILSLVLVASGIGVQRIGANFITALNQPGQVATFAFGQNLVNAMCIVAFAVVASKNSRYAYLMANGDRKLAVMDGVRIIGSSLYLSMAGLFVAGLVAPVAFDWIGSNADFPSFGLWLIYGVPYILYYVQQQWTQLYARTNQVLFLQRSLFASGLGLLGAWLGVHVGGRIEWFALGLISPLVLVFGLAPLRKLAQLAGVRVLTLLRETLHPQNLLWPFKRVLSFLGR